MAIGGYTPSGQVYEESTVLLNEGDTVYLFSDGYADQDGGEKGKKLMTRNFRQILMDLPSGEMSVQKQLLNQRIETWKGNREQLDDILVIGFQL
ncbi:hypothetical protein D3C86_1574950 [compost metagenome]